MSENVPRAAVVGAGPSGFYAADQLLKAGFEVDLLDALPTPFGLVRAGVAPDHPKIKASRASTRRPRSTAGFRFFGGVEPWRPTSAARTSWTATTSSLYAIGTATTTGSASRARTGPAPTGDRSSWPGTTAIPTTPTTIRPQRHARGRDRQRQRRRRRRPDARASSRRGRGDRHGRPRDRALVRLGVEEVDLLGRRGPAQAAFTTPELRELGELTRADIVVDPADLELDAASARWLERGADATSKRNVDLLREYAAARAARAPRTGSCCASCARPWRSSARATMAPSPACASSRNRTIENGRAVATATRSHRLRAGAALDRLPRHAGRRDPVRRAPRADPQRRRPRRRRERRAPASASTSSAGSSAGPPA